MLFIPGKTTPREGWKFWMLAFKFEQTVWWFNDSQITREDSHPWFSVVAVLEVVGSR